MKKILVILTSILIMISALNNMLIIKAEEEENKTTATKYVVVINDDVVARSEAKDDGAPLKIDNNTVIFVKGASYNIIGEDVKDNNENIWHLVNYSKDGKNYQAYIRDDNTLVEEYSFDTDYNFEEELNNFPVSYREKLTELHELHPNWIFKAYLTDISWDYAVSQETVLGRSTIQTNDLSKRSQQAGAYNAETGQYIPMDGSSWFQASQETIEYYMDPRNFLNEENIFMFLKLTYSASETVEAVSKILTNTFMSGNDPVDDKPYANIFMDAGSQADVSAIYLATLAIQEQGVNGSAASTGQSFVYDGQTYSGIYNFFNIHASAGAENWKYGLVWASETGSYDRPWISPYKAIVGGAKWIAAGYIDSGQDTLYFQKFNSATGVFWHQYQTNIQAAYSESYTIYRAYKSTEAFNSAIVFSIPVYLNMPNDTQESRDIEDEPEQIVNIFEALSLQMENGRVHGFDYGISVNDLINKMKLINNNLTIKVYRGENEVDSGSTLATSLKLVITGNKKALGIVEDEENQSQEDMITKEYIIVVKGDCNKDGKISSMDYVTIKNYIMDSSTISDEVIIEAADYNNDSKVTSLDYDKVKNCIMTGEY